MDLLGLVGTLSCRTNKPNRQFMGYSTSSRVVLEHLLPYFRTSFIHDQFLISWFTLLTIWLFNSSPWKIVLIGKPSIAMGHLYHGYVKKPEGISSCFLFPECLAKSAEMGKWPEIQTMSSNLREYLGLQLARTSHNSLTGLNH